MLYHLPKTSKRLILMLIQGALLDWIFFSVRISFNSELADPRWVKEALYTRVHNERGKGVFPFRFLTAYENLPLRGKKTTLDVGGGPRWEVVDDDGAWKGGTLAAA